MRDVTSETPRFQPVGETFVCAKVQRHDPAVTLEMFHSAKSTTLKKTRANKQSCSFPFKSSTECAGTIDRCPQRLLSVFDRFPTTANPGTYICLKHLTSGPGGPRPVNLCSGGISSTTKDIYQENAQLQKKNEDLHDDTIRLQRKLKEGDTSFSTLFQQFHKALAKYYRDGGQSLYDPSKMERFCEEHAPRIFEDIYDAIFNDEKQSPSEKRRKLQKSRVVAGSLL
ncbi:uncharacterized protein [Acropora muricata]|uniref:uncharacterized protein n=1 Tax=Acropora muricata TaxID=159855 RepID=UPI0034E4B130